VFVGSKPSASAATDKLKMLCRFIVRLPFFRYLTRDRSADDVAARRGAAIPLRALTSKRLIDTDPNTVRAFVAGGIETIDFILTPKADDVGRAFRLMSATCSDPCRPAVSPSLTVAPRRWRDPGPSFYGPAWAPPRL